MMMKARAARTALAIENGNQSTAVGKQLTKTDRELAPTTSIDWCISIGRQGNKRRNQALPSRTTTLGYN